jgi:hypothetical protein
MLPLPHGPLPCKSGKTTGHTLMPRYRALKPTTSAPSLMPLPAAQAAMFCLISPGSGSAVGEERGLALPSPKERV